MIRRALRRCTHRIVFHHAWKACVVIAESDGLPFAYEACEVCFYHDPQRPLGVYTIMGTDVFRVVVTDMKEGATIQ